MKPQPPNTHKGGQGESTEAIKALRIPRGDTNRVGEYKVIVTSGLHAQQKGQRNRKRGKATSGGSSNKGPEPVEREGWRNKGAKKFLMRYSDMSEALVRHGLVGTLVSQLF